MSLVAERLEDMREKLAKIGAFVAVAGMALTGPAKEASSFFEPGKMAVGCNYWASHAGVYMWRNWNPQQVEKDFDLLAAHGMTVVRVFPLWPDFQPLTCERGFAGKLRGFAQAGGALKNSAAVDDTMVERFRFLCKVAEKRKVKLIVGLLTGWMSGRCFFPSAFEHENVLTSPTAIQWECRYVRYLVQALKNEPSILAWDLGNECNCMGVADATEMWNWIHAISAEIRLADDSRKIISGFHGVKSRPDAQVNFRLVGELLDVSCTHPYPLWTPNCNLEKFDSIRNACHAPCETTLNAGLAGHVAIVEEAGSLGPGVASETCAARTMRMQLFGSWACGIPMYLWWCAFDQDKLGFSPYEWTSVERELGLFTSDGLAKPTALTLKEFADFTKSLPFDKLPSRQVDAAVIISETEDAWLTAQGAWLLSRRAGFDISYVRAEDPLPDSKFFILPSGEGYETYSRTAYSRALEKVRGGSTLLITLGNGAVLSNLREVAGVEVENLFQKEREIEADVCGVRVAFKEPQTRSIVPLACETLVMTKDRQPLMTDHRYGKGRVLLVNADIERHAQLVGWPLYRLAADRAGLNRRVRTKTSTVGLTEHPRSDGAVIVVAVNYENASASVPVEIVGRVGRVWRGACNGKLLKIDPCDAAVFEIK